jgi:Arc/MetJ-type ribon-helix-helix transcriptional regulator
MQYHWADNVVHNMEMRKLREVEGDVEYDDRRISSGVESGLKGRSCGRRTMTIEPDKETKHLIEQEIQSGRFRDAATFVGAAVRHFLITREDIGYSKEEIDAMIAQAIGSLERGEGIDGEEFFAALEKEDGDLLRGQR